MASGVALGSSLPKESDSKEILRGRATLAGAERVMRMLVEAASPLASSASISSRVQTPCRVPAAGWTLHPAPWTLHPAPWTLHPAPWTLHPAPCTRMPWSSDLGAISVRSTPDPPPCIGCPSRLDWAGIGWPSAAAAATAAATIASATSSLSIALVAMMDG